MFNKTFLTASVLSLALIGTVNAGYRDHKRGNDFTDTATVISSKPIYETIKTTIPEKICSDRGRHREYSYERSYNSKTDPIIGAIIGGVIGNQIGSGNGKTAATVAGTLLGASIGTDHREAKRALAHGRCHTIERTVTRDELVGYRVKYRYNGRIYRTRLDYDPGNQMKVVVNLTPHRSHWK